ncbi:chemotaxis protein CheD [Salibacterium halotolerans]|uniref:Probable chemoreceptor glutamine deamidase CheD n=2 Tax=Salibacterium halotolerans TaxID=1884432 RepID=A0A1I5MF99_9BACI|nr:chemotaxis protein CheD [Salibacterium halotolerans]
MADWKTAEAPERLRTSGLGSCVGVVLYEEGLSIAAMAHIMLPDSSMAAGRSLQRAKFADTALEDVLACLKEKGCSLRRLQAKLAGGAQMFSFSEGSDMSRIGPRNSEAVKAVLKENGIPVKAEDTGGSKGRTIEFSIMDSSLYIRTVNEGKTII